MDLFIIDAIGPFFRELGKNRINWSKIPFAHLKTSGPEADDFWLRIEADMRHFAGEVSSLGYNAVTLDDLAHLVHHPLHEPEIAANIAFFRRRFRRIFAILGNEFGLKIFLTTDVIPMTPAISASLQGNKKAAEDYYLSLVGTILDDFPELSGLIVRIGESDGQDVTDLIRTSLHLRNPRDTNRLLRRLLPIFDQKEKTLILRTWTVGAHRIGDLIWHRGTLAETLDGLNSPNFIVSMKHGESDFFRYIPLNNAFFRIDHKKIIELQARREYEGAGEFPSYIGRDCESFARELAGATNMAGISVWSQTGGWHRFRRLAFLPGNRNSDIWIRLNAAAAIDIFRHGKSIGESVAGQLGPVKAPHALELLHDADDLILSIYYIGDFARRKLFFRRVRIPPLLHLYWDCLFINHAVSKTLRHFIPDPENTIRSGEAAAEAFPRMILAAGKAGLPIADIEHMRDLFSLILLARRYYFLPFDNSLADQIRKAKKEYKKRYPSTIRLRYRIKLSFEPFKLKRRTLAWLASFLLRKKRGYRLIDHLFTLHLLGYAYRLFKPRDPKSMPKFLRKTAMGIDSLFK